MKPIILVPAQEAVTLDECLLDQVTTFTNGCDYRLLCRLDGTHWLEIGCYGIHVNLVQGKGLILYQWFTENNDELKPKKLTGVALPQTIRELALRPQCNVCGGMRWDMVTEMHCAQPMKKNPTKGHDRYTCGACGFQKAVIRGINGTVLD